MMKSASQRKYSPWLIISAAALTGLLSQSSAMAGESAFLPRTVNSSTIPGNGDVNPYGVAFVPAGFPAGGALAAGDVLVSNFNNSGNLQGTGTTIVQLRPGGPLAPTGTAVTFFASPLAGLSTALGAVRGGFVVVGNVPTTDGSIKTIGQGALQVIDSNGHAVQTWSDKHFLDSPWDLTIDDHGSWARIFVSNVLSGTVTRLDVAVASSGLTILGKTRVASGYKTMPNTAALVLGPTGLAYDEPSDTLFVASTADNAIYAVSQAGHRMSAETLGSVVFAGPPLRGPLALRFAPGGDLLAANGDAVKANVLHPSEIVEITTSGQFVRQYDVDSSQGGSFGIDTVLEADAPYNYAAIDDVTNNLLVTHIGAQ
jgi:hypothetical protein